MRKLKTGDVFRFQFKPEEGDKRHMPHHCFDGQLVFVDGVFYDSYWGFPNPDNMTWSISSDHTRRFTLAEIRKIGHIKFICNLDDVEPAAKWEWCYYKKGDFFNLSYQHGCCKKFVKRKEARRSQKLMLEAIRLKRREMESSINSIQNQLERLSETEEKVKSGRLENVYI